VQHGLVKVSYTTRKSYQFWPLILTRNEVEEANKAVAKVNGATSTAKYFPQNEVSA